jgi:hypothetical protein
LEKWSSIYSRGLQPKHVHEVVIYASKPLHKEEIILYNIYI